MRKNINFRSWVMSALLFLSTGIVLAQTPTTDLTTHQPTAAPPAGTTLEWHTGILSSSPLVTTPTAVAPGLYFGFYNYGSGCYSEGAPVRVLTNSCPTTTTDLNNAVNAAPAGSTLSFHSTLPVSDANAMTGTAITAATAGTYFVAYKTVVGGASCYSQANPIVVVNTSCYTCLAGVAAPLLSASTKANTCPALTIDLTTITASNNPGGTIALTWHTGTPATAANQVKAGNPVTNPAAVPAGTYYAAFYDATNNCYSGSTSGSATTAVTATVSNVCVGTPSVITGLTGSIITGNVPSATGGTGAYSYVIDLTCTAPSGYTSLTAAGGTVNGLNATTGAHTVTAPNTVGNYYYCIKVCDASGTNCAVSIHKVIVTASVTPVAVTPPATITGVIGTTITGNVPNATGGTSPYTYSNGSSDPGCVAPSGHTALATAGGSINGLNTSTGTHTITAPNAVGNYYYCIKVCDTSGTNCAVSIHKVTTTPLPCNAGYASPKIVKN